MNVRMLELLGGLVLFVLLFLGIGRLWGVLFPKDLPPMPEQHPGEDEECCAHQHSKNTDADRES